LKYGKYGKLIRLVEKETGMRFKVRPKIRPHRRRRPLGYETIDWKADDEKRKVVIKKATIYVRHPSKSYARKYPFEQIVVHELLENLYIQNRIRYIHTVSRKRAEKLLDRAHNFAKRYERRILKRLLEKGCNR